MNLGRIKIIFLALILVVIGLMIATHVVFWQSAAKMDETVVDNIVALLSENGIYVDRSQIQTKKQDAYNLTMNNAALDKENTPGRILGEGFETVSDTEYRSGAAVLQMIGNQIRYTCERNTERIAHTAVSSRTDQLAEHHLKQLGFDSDTYFMYNKRLENGILTFEIMPRFGSCKIEGVHLDVKADNAGVLEMEGTWFYTAGADTLQNKSFCSITSVLVNFMYLQHPSVKTISRIDACYYIPSTYLSANTITPLPVYILLCTDDSVTIFNADDGTLILQYP